MLFHNALTQPCFYNSPFLANSIFLNDSPSLNPPLLTHAMLPSPNSILSSVLGNAQGQWCGKWTQERVCGQRYLSQRAERKRSVLQMLKTRASNRAGSNALTSFVVLLVPVAVASHILWLLMLLLLAEHVAEVEELRHARDNEEQESSKDRLKVHLVQRRVCRVQRNGTKAG